MKHNNYHKITNKLPCTHVQNVLNTLCYNFLNLPMHVNEGHSLNYDLISLKSYPITTFYILSRLKKQLISCNINNDDTETGGYLDRPVCSAC